MDRVIRRDKTGWRGMLGWGSIKSDRSTVVLGDPRPDFAAKIRVNLSVT